MIKIPDHAQCVFTGVIYDVYQWQQKTFSGEIKTYEALKRPDVAVIIATDGDSILLAHEEQAVIGSFWAHFGGFIDKDEEPLEAAKRELSEEAGLAAKQWILLSIYDHPGKVFSQTFVYLARSVYPIGEQQLDDGERIEVVSVSWKRWLELISTDAFRGREEIRNFVFTDQNPQKAMELQQLFFGKNMQ